MLAGNSKGVVLISPLDWGLGHATRCVPLIRSLINNRYSVMIATSGPSSALLKMEFPDCIHLESPSARFSYSRRRWMFALSVIAQIPKLYRLAKQETRWLEKLSKEYNINLVISDSRYGMYHRKIPSVFISHQLGIKTGLGFLADKIVQKQNFRYIGHFTECWVPDMHGDEAVAGDLSNPAHLPSIPVNFIGLQSRLKKLESVDSGGILIMLSGPEPQRTLLENIINDQLSGLNEKVVFVRGLPDGGAPIEKHAGVAYYDHLSAEQLSAEVSKAELVICRSGYSSVMDLLSLNKKGIYIPTPGQPEQEYLGKRLGLQKRGVVFRQENFVLSKAINKARTFNYVLPPINESEQFLKRVESLIKK